VTAREVGLRIRAAVPADLPAVLELWQSADVKPSPTDDLAALAALVAHDPEALLVVDDAGLIAGSLVAGFDGWRGNLYRLAVRPSHRRRGLGRALLLEAAERLRARGARRVSALVLRDDVQAVGFWSSLQAEGLRLDSSKTRWILNLEGEPSAAF
jgi:ribosomal protein S18 acetylase RimI-like enzyme